jgi:toxin CcdB
MVKPRQKWRQFDVFLNPDRSNAEDHPYLIVLQSNRLSDLDTCVVAPLLRAKTIKLFERLLPEVLIDGVKFKIAIPDLGAFPPHLISAPIANLESERYRIVAAIDLVFTGV